MPAAAPVAAAAGPIEVRVPDIGDFKDVAVIELLVKPGDTVKAEQSLITVESDKASMEIPSAMRAWSRTCGCRSATRSSKARWCSPSKWLVLFLSQIQHQPNRSKRKQLLKK